MVIRIGVRGGIIFPREWQSCKYIVYVHYLRAAIIRRLVDDKLTRGE
jgi:hypothetical protein